MTSFGQLMAFGAGSLFLGAALTLRLLCRLASRNTDDPQEHSATVFCLIVLALAVLFFAVAVRVPTGLG